MWVTNTGSFAWDKTTGNAGLEFPQGSGRTAVFAAGLWLGGMVGGATRVVVAEYSDEYGPGAMVGGQADNPNRPEYKVYKLNRVYPSPALRDAALADYEAGAEPHGAPDVEVQPDGSLNIPGHQMLWAVYNDADLSNHNSRAGSTPPLGVEVQQTTFGFNLLGPLGQTVFSKFRIINKGGNTITDMYLSLWSDPDLGGFTDDLVGCDVGRNLGFCYNATNNDAMYGSAPPAVGYDLLQGPNVGGLPLPMTSFNKYINGTDPQNFTMTYNYMRGLNPDGTPLINPVTSQVTTYAVSGDPVTGTGWLDTNPSDRRLAVSSGPITMAPGDMQEIVVAIIIADGASRLSSISLLRSFDDQVQAIFDGGLEVVGVSGGSRSGLDLRAWPNPGRSAEFGFVLPTAGQVRVSVHDLAGRRLSLLADGELPAGPQLLHWDGRRNDGVRAGSGVYFVRVVTPAGAAQLRFVRLE
jgi:hypothetical protein